MSVDLEHPSLFQSSPVILDGGLGTTLNQNFGVDLDKSPLWSTQQVIDDPRVIVEAHLSFLRAGAQIIMTSTYQASTQTFKNAGLSVDFARSAMLKSVYLANEARTQHLKENPDAGEIKIALSLGPFAATLSPAQEFSGFYPPPYGPRAYSAGGENINSFGDDTEGEMQSIQALADFHLDNLRIFREDDKAWSFIDIVAFETVPILREVIAVRQAVARLENTLKPWWISFVLPDGKCPETRCPGGGNLTVADLVGAALRDHLNPQVFGPIPSGLGINCTHPDKIPGILHELTLAVSKERSTDMTKPWLILYPNSGEIYDTGSRTYRDLREEEGYQWENHLAKVVRDFNSQPENLSAWSGIVVGGCCRVGPLQIRRLKESLRGLARPLIA